MHISAQSQTRANEAIAEAMTTALGLWFAPVVSGVACNVAEAVMVKALLSKSGSKWGARESDEIYWFFRKRYLALNVATYIPSVGPPLQVLEVFALGQFTLACVERDVRADDSEALAAAWKQIQPLVWSGERVVGFYEEYAGKKFPKDAKAPFIKAVDTAGQIAHGIARELPFVGGAQEVAGEVIREGIGAAKKGLKWLLG